MKKKLLFSLIASIAIYLILVSLSFLVNRRLNNSIKLLEYYVAETQQIRAAGILLRTIESDVHSYLISGNKKNIANLESDFQELDHTIAFIEQQTDESPVQQQRIEELQRLKLRRRNLFTMAIEAYRGGRLSTEQILSSTQAHSQVSEDMLAVLREIDGEELRLLEAEKVNLHKLQVQNYILDVAAGLGPLVIAFFTVFSLVKTVNERRRIEQQLHELNQNKDKFISIIGHDLKGPAGAIKLMAELLVQNRETMEPEQRHKLHQRLLRATDNHLKLLQDILTWARTQTSKIEFTPSSINLQNLVEETFLQNAEVASNKGIALNNMVPPDTMVLADENMLRTVIRNLVQNAIKFTKKGGSVEISAAKDDGNVSIFVADTGVGMSGEKLRKLFTVGNEVSTKGTEGEPGTGLGLIISKEFIEKNNGRIYAKSELGRGSVFTIMLPTV